MRFNVALAAAACISGALGVSLKCVPGLEPYCCDDLVTVSELDVAIGVLCTKEPHGHVAQCKKDLVKGCCTKTAVDLLGIVTLCQTPLQS